MQKQLVQLYKQAQAVKLIFEGHMNYIHDVFLAS